MIPPELSKWLSGKESVCQCRRHEFNLWVGKIPGEGNGKPLQYSCLKYPMNRGAWQATVHRAAKSQTQLRRHALQYRQPANQPLVAAFASCYSQALLLLTQ